MSVTGYLALYTTLIGWQQYQNLWNIMVGCGMVFIPFIGIVMKCFIEPYESQEPKSAAVIALRRLMISIVGALIIIEFCCVPTVPLEPKVLHYEPVCVVNPKVATPGDTGTTYDNQFPTPTGAKVPIIWYLVMAVSNGFTHAATEGLKCSPIDYQTIENQLNLNHITDPKIKKQTVEFYSDCYIPAYSQYMSGDLSDTQKQEITNYQKQYGKDDINWLGSHAFTNVPGLYDALFARQPIEGFTYDPTRDQYEGQVANHSKWGQPNCKDWWTSPQNGLQAKLEQALPPSFLDEITHLASKTQFADLGIKQLIVRSFDSGMSISDRVRGFESLNNETGSNAYAYLSASIGVGIHALTYSPKLYLLINALPIIQALLLLGIYALLAIMIPFSSYRLHFIITGSTAIFAITFWNYLWHLTHYIDNALIHALYGQNLSFLTHPGPNSVLVHFIVGTSYVGLPALFLIISTWAGLKVGNGLTSVISEMKAPADAAGTAGGAMMKEALTKAIKVAFTKGAKA